MRIRLLMIGIERKWGLHSTHPLNRSSTTCIMNKENKQPHFDRISVLIIQAKESVFQTYPDYANELSKFIQTE